MRRDPRAFLWDVRESALAIQTFDEFSRIIFRDTPRAFAQDALVHTQAVAVFSQPDMESALDYEHRHKAIIYRFGRYPHRNAILGRTSSAEELAFLSEPGSSF